MTSQGPPSFFIFTSESTTPPEGSVMSPRLTSLDVLPFSMLIQTPGGVSLLDPQPLACPFREGFDGLTLGLASESHVLFSINSQLSILYAL